MSRPFVPILLGTEVGVYGMARAFWEAYGVKSYAYGTFPLTPTRHSKFIEQRCDEGFAEPDRFVEILNRDAGTFGDAIPLVIPCGDDYSLLLSAHKNELDPRLVAITSDAGVLDELNNKSRFYALCERAGVPYPRAVTISGMDDLPNELPFPFPVAVKPTDAASYREHEFEGQKKAFIIEDRAMLEETIRRVYASGYDAQLVIQDFVPGDDSNMRTMNGYVRQDGSVALLALGRPILEDPEPMRIGNYVAIISYGDERLYATVEQLLSHIHYFGYFNLDMKYDPRDGSYKLLDFNPRQGRSSFFVTLAGHNLARCVVEDVVEGKKGPAVHADDEYLWVGMSRLIVRHYTPKGPGRDQALALMRAGKVGTTLFGAHDNHPKRLYYMGRLWLSYFRDFQRFFGHRELEV
ncbi:MAG: hypothetical protein Q4D48_02540 [Coriobacteriales bacterium]|nr:hypothetical protein [Coriobacteriales bacterium]